MTHFSATTPAEISAYQAIVLKGALKLLSVGLSPGRGWSKAKAMKLASKFTGKVYKRTDCKVALADMTAYVAELEGARS